MNIAIFTGGDSSESVISVKSAEEMALWLKSAGHQAHTVVVKGSKWTVTSGVENLPVDKNNLSFKGPEGEVRFDFVWNMIHGTPGEDGKLQGFFDVMNMPYSSCNHMSSALTFNKYACKIHLKQLRILTPEAALIRKGDKYDIEELGEKVGFPCFVKPNNGGSSFGISKVVKAEELKAAIRKALAEDREVIIERYVKGRELTCGIMKVKGEFRTLPITEVIPGNEFFDYEAKYEGKSQEITPADLKEDIRKLVNELSCRIYDLCDCSGVVRVDFILKGNQIHFLELNSIPGMSRESIIPQQVEVAGLKMEQVLQDIINEATR